MDTNKSLFSFGDVKNHPHRAGFDLACKNAFTAKVGELLPVYWKLCLPGDKFNLKHEHFTRTQPVNTSSYTRIREYFDWYFVPFRLISKSLPQAVVQMQANPVQASSLTQSRIVTTDLPYTSLSSISGLLSYSVLDASSSPNYLLNSFGFKVSACSSKLLSYLRYGSFRNPVSSTSFGLTADDALFNYASDLAVNVLPLAAYQKIYADYFRYQQWEKNEPYTYNFDYYAGGNVFSSLINAASLRSYMSNNNLLTLRYSNWHKDLYMGVLPSSQLGDVATVTPTTTSSTAFVNWLDTTVSPNVSNGPVVATQAGTSPTTTTFALRTGTGNTSNMKMGVDSASISSFNIIQLRLAEATQRWREISQCSDQTYRDQLYAHFGVKLSPALSDTCRYVGGTASNLDISEVLNTNLADGGSADIKGKGIGSGSGFENFYADEHGILMCIYHATPILDYVISGPDLTLLSTTTASLPVPEYDSIGMESLPTVSFTNSNKVAVANPSIDLLKSIMGYVPRYIGYKTSVDTVNGAFISTLKDWVAPVDPDYLATWFKSSITTSASSVMANINFNFFKTNPAMLDKIFGVAVDSTWDTDQLLVNSYFDVKSVRNLDYSGMPY